MKYKTLSLLLLMFISGNAQAEWKQELSISHVLGDSDSRISAREIIIEQIRRLAAQEAGQYVQGTQSLDNGQFRESIEILSAAMIHVRTKKESAQLTPDGRLSLTITADVTLDDKELRNRIDNLQQDKTLQTKLSAFESENKRLQRNMLMLAQQARANADTETASKLLNEQISTIQSIQNNRAKVESSFAPGTLQELLALQDDRGKEFAQKLEKELLEPLIRTAKISVKYESIQEAPRQGGRKFYEENIRKVYDVKVRYEWAFDLAFAKSYLAPYVKMRDYSLMGNKGLVIEKMDTPDGELVFEYLRDRHIKVVSRMGRDQPIFALYPEVSNPESLNFELEKHNVKRIYLVNQDAKSSLMAYQMRSNPVVYQVNEWDLDKVDMIGAELTLTGESRFNESPNKNRFNRRGY